MSRTVTRRSVLKGLAQSAASVLLLENALAARSYAANEKLNLAHIGVGGRGTELLGSFCTQANVVALCDVNKSKAQRMFDKFPAAPRFEDFRKMLDEKAKEIDAVVVATPDHTHAVAAVAAMKAGKHVYVEKPMAGCVYEARVMRETAEKQKVATQMGNQGSSSGQFRRGVELIQDGALGEIKEVYVWNCGGGADVRDIPKDT
ncbi:MAG: Gfo/Idh/MocA family oxidoreductase, partial [Planctomycetota bacterium]|nr:Gfo/Idh/MocA family oxidoreductase [Planctomycetota bacterium]